MFRLKTFPCEIKRKNLVECYFENQILQTLSILQVLSTKMKEFTQFSKEVSKSISKIGAIVRKEFTWYFSKTISISKSDINKRKNTSINKLIKKYYKPD